MWGRYREMGTDFVRLYALTDGVFAIVLTLLTFNIKIPPLPRDATDLQVWNSLGLDFRDVIGYALSYLVVGIFWTVHHRMFRHVVRHDRRLVWRNLAFLFFLSLLPFTTTLSTATATARLPWVLYAGNITLVGTSLAMLWRYALRADHISPDLDEKTRKNYFEGAASSPIIFLLSMIVAIWDLEIARLVPLLLIPYGLLRQKSEELQTPSDAPQ
ncbi:DUF1211 domain-containing protein [bacterium]|nr:MAG: DUF1211 domain-containing protein [bacterium]